MVCAVALSLGAKRVLCVGGQTTAEGTFRALSQSGVYRFGKVALNDVHSTGISRTRRLDRFPDFPAPAGPIALAGRLEWKSGGQKHWLEFPDTAVAG
jgi:hypothetical protein